MTDQAFVTSPMHVFSLTRILFLATWNKVVIKNNLNTNVFNWNVAWENIAPYLGAEFCT